MSTVIELDAAPPDNGTHGSDEVQKSAGKCAVPEKYQGTAADKYDMASLGKEQTLRRNLSLPSTVGFASSVMASWEALLALYGLVLATGGPALAFWAFIIEVCGMTAVYASLAELVSMRTVSLCAIGWQVYLAGVCFMVAGIIQGLVTVNHPSYRPEPWHATLITVTVIFTVIVFNFFLATRIPLTEGIVLLLHFLAWVTIIVPLWVMAPRAPASVALLHFTNNGNWSTTGLSASIGSFTTLNVLIGYDSSVHMAEEVKNASLVLPQAIMWSIALNASLVLVMIVTLAFTAGDAEALLSSKTGEPFIQIFLSATQSRVYATIMTSVVVVILCACCFSEVATASRQLWSFARDGGVPASKWVSHVNQERNLPWHAVVVSFIVVSALACINLGSTTALRSISSLGGVAILTSYEIVIGCLVWYRLSGRSLPDRRWSLGCGGLYVNIAAMIFILPLWFFAFWPLAANPQPAAMNWSSLIFGGVLLFAMIYYIVWGQHTYTAPVVLVKRENHHGSWPETNDRRGCVVQSATERNTFPRAHGSLGTLDTKM